MKGDAIDLARNGQLFHKTDCVRVEENEFVVSKEGDVFAVGTDFKSLQQFITFKRGNALLTTPQGGGGSMKQTTPVEPE